MLLATSAQNGVDGVAFSHDGKLLASADAGTMRLCEVSPFANPYVSLCSDVPSHAARLGSARLRRAGPQDLRLNSGTC